MKVSDYSGTHDVSGEHELEMVLATRYENNSNCFWISHEGVGEYPMLGLVVKDDLAHLSYFPKEYDAGFSSSGKLGESLEGETTTFFISRGGDKIWVINDAVLPFSCALQATKEFLYSKALPRSVEWEQL
jgi:hypothetical protein